MAPVPGTNRSHPVIALLLLAVTLFCAADAEEAGGGSPVDRVMDTLSLAGKAGQMILVYHSPCEFLRRHNIGGVLIMQTMVKNPAALRRELDRTQKALPLPLLVTIDQEGGSVNRLSSVKGWERTPSAKRLRSWGTDSIGAYARSMAAELKALGVNMNLAPVLDPAVNAANQNTYMETTNRSFGNGVAAIGPPVRAFIDGFAAENVLCVTKHFPGYDVTANSDLELAHSDADSTAIAGYVDVFRSSTSNSGGIMMSSIRYRSLSGEPAVLTPSIVAWARTVSDSGIIMTDDLWGVALRSSVRPGITVAGAPYPDSAFALLVEKAVLAGNDMLMITYPQKVPLMIQTIVAMAERDENVRTHLDGAVRRILGAKLKLGLIGGQAQ